MTTLPTELDARTATEADLDAVQKLLGRAFLDGTDETEVARARLVFEPDRNLMLTDGDTVVANVAAYTRDLTVPGAVVPAAHVSEVSVHPAYRRRGLLTQLIHRQLAELPEPVAVLWASEGTIYQRYGYGAASQRLAFEADRSLLRFLPRIPAGPGRITEAAPGDVRADLAGVYDRVWPQQVGWSSRSTPWWDKLLLDPPTSRNGFSERYALRYHGPDGVDGYALWSTKSGDSRTGPAGVVRVREVVAATAEAYTALWRFLLSVDLTRTVAYPFGALDEPLLHLVEEPRALGGRHQDGLWVRVVDLPAALTARRYAAPVDVVLEITDRLLPRNAGRWRLRADTSGATCQPTPEPADLALDVADLGAAYLGGTGLATLARTGRVRELRLGALAPASVAFGWSNQPSAIEIF